MLRFLLAGLLLLGTCTAYCQQHEELVTMYKQHKYNEVIDSSRSYLRKDNTDASAYEMLGEALYDLKKYDSCMLMEQKALKYDQEKTIISCWAHIYLGRCFHANGKRQMALEEFEKSIAPNATDRMIQYSRAQIQRMKFFQQCFNNEKAVEREHIVFHFQDTTGNFQQFADSHEQSYLRLNKVFNATLPGKICYCIYSHPEIVRTKLCRSIGTTNVKGLEIVTNADQTSGHELIHILAYWAWGSQSVTYNGFIDEGLAIAFEDSSKNLYEIAKTVKKRSVSSVTDIWKAPESYRISMLYPVSGAFVYYLLKNSTEDEFRSIIKNQSYEHAQQVYGDRLDKMINDFDHMIGIKQ